MICILTLVFRKMSEAKGNRLRGRCSTPGMQIVGKVKVREAGQKHPQREDDQAYA